MSILDQINLYISAQTEPKRQELQRLHDATLQLQPTNKLWFTDGKNEQGKVVANPNIGYGSYLIKYADGTAREFYRIGLSANTTGISVYVMGLEDKKFLSETYGKTLGKASVTGYCIKFRSLKDIDFDVLLAAIQHGFDVDKA